MVSIKPFGTGLMKGLRTRQVIPDKPVKEMWNNTEYKEIRTSVCNFTQPMKNRVFN